MIPLESDDPSGIMKSAAQQNSKRNESAEKTLRLMIELIKGKQHDRYSAARLLGTEHPAASRYLKAALAVPGVERVPDLRALTLRFNPNQLMEAPHFSVVIAACLSMSLAGLFEGTSYQDGILKACNMVLNRSTKKSRFGKSSDLARKFIFVKGGGEQALPDKAGMLDDIIDAILSQKSLNIKHIEFDGSIREVCLRPLSAAIYKHQLYLLGYDSQNQPLIFRFSRIQECNVVEDIFEYPTKAEYDPPRLFEPCFGVFVGMPEPAQLVTIRLDKRWKTYVRNHRWHRSQEVTITSEEIIMKLRVQTCPELVAWILGFGGDAEVLEPSELREKVRAKIQEMARRYAA